MKTVARSMILCLAVLSSGCAIWHGKELADQSAGFAFQEENDSIAPGNLDKYYTQGMRFGKTFNPKNNPEIIQRIDKSLERFWPELRKETIWTLGIAQTMYTPDDITTATPQPYDRPWAGFLYLDNILRVTEFAPVPHKQHFLELQTGVIGPYSGAHWAQGGLHALIGSPRPVGWGNQIASRPGVELIYLYNRRHARKHVDFVHFVGGAAGTTLIYANAGGYARLGCNMTTFMNTGIMQGTLAVTDNVRAPIEFWFYAGADARAVGYNLFLNNGVIEPKPFVYDLLGGFSLRVKSYRVTYNWVRRSKEFSHPLGPQFGHHDFASVLLSYELIIPR